MARAKEEQWPYEAWVRAQSVLDGHPTPAARRIVRQSIVRLSIVIAAVVVGCIAFGVIGSSLDVLPFDQPELGEGIRFFGLSLSFWLTVGYAAIMIIGLIGTLLNARKAPRGGDPSTALRPAERRVLDSAIGGRVALHPSWAQIAESVARRRAGDLFWVTLYPVGALLLISSMILNSSGVVMVGVALLIAVLVVVITLLHGRRMVAARRFLRATGPGRLVSAG